MIGRLTEVGNKSPHKSHNGSHRILEQGHDPLQEDDRFPFEKQLPFALYVGDNGTPCVSI